MAKPTALALLVLAVGCTDTIAAPHDADDTDAAVDVNLFDAPPAHTCADLVLRAVVSLPGGARGYPGARLTLEGDDLDTVDRVSVGGVPQPFTREGATLVTRVPPMLATGARAVTVESPRCSTSAFLTISRLVA